MARQKDKRFRPWSLIDATMTGARHNMPDKILICYRYKKQYDDLSSIHVFGYENDRTTPVMLCHSRELKDSECPYERKMVLIVELKNYHKILEIEVIVSHYESLRNVFVVTGVWNATEVPNGKVIEANNFDCGT